MFNHPDSCKEHKPSHFDWIMACPGCIDEAKKQLTAKDARIEELIQNIRDMKYWAESGYTTQTIKIADEALQHKE